MDRARTTGCVLSNSAPHLVFYFPPALLLFPVLAAPTGNVSARVCETLLFGLMLALSITDRDSVRVYEAGGPLVPPVRSVPWHPRDRVAPRCSTRDCQRLTRFLRVVHGIAHVLGLSTWAFWFCDLRRHRVPKPDSSLLHTQQCAILPLFDWRLRTGPRERKHRGGPLRGFSQGGQEDRSGGPLSWVGSQITGGVTCVD